jgi:hypothetical protein
LEIAARMSDLVGAELFFAIYCLLWMDRGPLAPFDHSRAGK